VEKETMKSIVKNMGTIDLPAINGEYAMIPFDCETFCGLPDQFIEIAQKMLSGIKANGTAFFTIHGKALKAGQTLRRGGPHTDGNYEPHVMTFGGGGWKVGQNGPAINTTLHHEQYNNPLGGIVIATNYTSAVGYVGEFDGLPNTGGDCSHISLNEPFPLVADTVWYGNNHFIHESLPVNDDVHRVMARITLPITHTYQ
jgi:hypothetical protein